MSTERMRINLFEPSRRLLGVLGSNNNIGVRGHLRANSVWDAEVSVPKEWKATPETVAGLERLGLFYSIPKYNWEYPYPMLHFLIPSGDTIVAVHHNTDGGEMRADCIVIGKAEFDAMFE